MFISCVRKSKIQNPKSKIQNPKSKIQNRKSKMQNPKSSCGAVACLMIACAQVVLLSVDSNLVALLTTDILSQKPFVGPIIGIPIILSLYRKASFISISICSAKNSKPKVDASTVACFLIYHTMGVRLMKNSNPVCDLRFILLPACAASTFP